MKKRNTVAELKDGVEVEPFDGWDRTFLSHKTTSSYLFTNYKIPEHLVDINDIKIGVQWMLKSDYHIVKN